MIVNANFFEGGSDGSSWECLSMVKETLRHPLQAPFSDSQNRF